MSKVDRLMTRNRQIAEIGEFIVNPIDAQATSADSTTVVQLVLTHS